MSTDGFKKQEKETAKAQLSKIEAAMILIKNNTLGCEIHIAGLKIGICENRKVLPALKHLQREIEKYLKDEPNMYE